MGENRDLCWARPGTQVWQTAIKVTIRNLDLNAKDLTEDKDPSPLRVEKVGRKAVLKKMEKKHLELEKDRE